MNICVRSIAKGIYVLNRYTKQYALRNIEDILKHTNITKYLSHWITCVLDSNHETGVKIYMRCTARSILSPIYLGQEEFERFMTWHDFLDIVEEIVPHATDDIQQYDIVSEELDFMLNRTHICRATAGSYVADRVVRHAHVVSIIGPYVCIVVDDSAHATFLMRTVDPDIDRSRIIFECTENLLDSVVVKKRFQWARAIAIVYKNAMEDNNTTAEHFRLELNQDPAHSTRSQLYHKLIPISQATALNNCLQKYVGAYLNKQREMPIIFFEMDKNISASHRKYIRCGDLLKDILCYYISLL